MRSTRQGIVDAALASVREHGWAATSMDGVRQRAGVSNGSLFHHFPTRADLEHAVVAAGQRDHEAFVLDALAHLRTAHAGVRGVVLAHLAWLEDNRNVGRLLLDWAPAMLYDSLPDQTRVEHRHFIEEVVEWLSAHGWRGSPDLGVVASVWVGATNNHTRRGWLSAGTAPTDAARTALADAAWRGLEPHLHGVRKAKVP